MSLRAGAVQEDFGSYWYVWYTDRWHASSKPVFCWGYVAETEADLREQLDSVMAAAVPELRARLAAAEAAAGRVGGRGGEGRDRSAVPPVRARPVPGVSTAGDAQGP